MPLQVRDANGSVRGLPASVDPVYRFAGSIADTSIAGTACDFLLVTGASTRVTRVVQAKFRLVGAGTAGTCGISMNRVTAAPTGQTNTAVTGYAHDPSDPSAATTVTITPNTSQTPGTLPLELGSEVVSLSLFSTTSDLLNALSFGFPTGPKRRQKPIIVPAGGFLTFRSDVAIPSGSVLYFDLMVSEAAN